MQDKFNPPQNRSLSRSTEKSDRRSNSLIAHVFFFKAEGTSTKARTRTALPQGLAVELR